MATASESKGRFQRAWRRLPLWAKVPLVLMASPLFVVWAAFMVAFLAAIFVALPVLLLGATLDDRRRRRAVTRAGRAASWADAEAGVRGGTGTLVVGIGPKGPGGAWYLPHPPAYVDASRLAPTYADFQDEQWDLAHWGNPFVGEWDDVLRERFSRTALYLDLPRGAVDALPADVRGEAVLVSFGFDPLTACDLKGSVP